MQKPSFSSAQMSQVREYIESTLAHLDHVLPGQAPIQDFVHHNTIHGYQHLPFEKALLENEALTGISGYLPEQEFRKFYQQQRINDADITAALAHNKALDDELVVCSLGQKVIKRKHIYRIAMLFDLTAITSNQLNWQIEELDALTSLQADVPKDVSQQILAEGRAPAEVVQLLWQTVINQLGIDQAALQAEQLLELDLQQAEYGFSHEYQGSAKNSLHQLMQQHSKSSLNQLIQDLGERLTLRGFILAVTGNDILDSVRPQLIRICASAIDEGVAPWQLPDRREQGLYGAWRLAVQYDANAFFQELPDGTQILAALPENSVDAIIQHLTELHIPQTIWGGYLRRLALELPGWSGMINWRQHNSQYKTENDAKPCLTDYLAIRLTLDRLWLNLVCHQNWHIEANLTALNTYFTKYSSEFLLRQQLYQHELPEFLAQQIEALILHSGWERQNSDAWHKLANHVWVWLDKFKQRPDEHTVLDSGWRLFRLCQLLGLNIEQISALHKDDLLKMLTVLDEFTLTERNQVWLYAYEYHYREAFLQAIRANHNRGRWDKRDTIPQAQIIFCIDDREEGFRRHLEEFNPAIETFGAAGFFGVAINYKGLDDERVTPLCPIVVTPAHEVHERARIFNEQRLVNHNRGRRLGLFVGGLVHQSLRKSTVFAHLVIDLISPITLIGLLLKSVIPTSQNRIINYFFEAISPAVDTELDFTSSDTDTVATPEQTKLGFTDEEQADRVAGFLRNNGLTYGLSELVILMGHGSISQNNPHLAAYDCGACSGRHGGPNARVFAAMANRPEIRELVAERGIEIPQDTWFIGAEHNTCNEDIIWYDLSDLPDNKIDAFTKLKQDLRHAQQMSAHERCRRLASAPRNPTPEQALAHIEQRAVDFSQARPELGHATNASAVVGRRSLTQGVFFDRRAFLISYDPTQDPDGTVLEGILLAVGPVGAGINLEYYFSTVNNERFGCGSKVPHNVTGFFGVMEGTSSDLRTGLPSQMIEIHEAMRLQIFVEAKTSVLEQIYARQESLSELIGGGWVLLSCKDPETGEIYVFERDQGFVLWQAPEQKLQLCDKSPDCYQDQTLPVAPKLIKQPQMMESV